MILYDIIHYILLIPYGRCHAYVLAVSQHVVNKNLDLKFNTLVKCYIFVTRHYDTDTTTLRSAYAGSVHPSHFCTAL